MAISKLELAVSRTSRLTGRAARSSGVVLIYLAVAMTWFGLFGIPLLLEYDFVFMPALTSKHIVPYLLTATCVIFFSGAFTSRVIINLEEAQLCWALAPAFGLTWWMALVACYHLWASMR